MRENKKTYNNRRLLHKWHWKTDQTPSPPKGQKKEHLLKPNGGEKKGNYYFPKMKKKKLLIQNSSKDAHFKPIKAFLLEDFMFLHAPKTIEPNSSTKKI